MVAVEQSLPGNIVVVAELVVADIISTSYSWRRNKHWKEKRIQHLLLQKDPACLWNDAWHGKMQLKPI